MILDMAEGCGANGSRFFAIVLLRSRFSDDASILACPSQSISNVILHCTAH